MTSPRDYSAMWDHGTCVLCGESQHIERVAHMREHLADGTATVEKAFGKPDRVVPTSSLPVKDTADDPTPPTPKALPRGARAFYGKSFRKGA